MDIIYASASGNTELVVEKISQLHNEAGYTNKLHKAEITDISVIENGEYFVFATSTWEHGEINPYFDSLLKKLKKIDCSNKKAWFVSLGDSRYEPVLLCTGIETLRNTFIENRGEQIGKTLKIIGEPHEILNTIVKHWVIKSGLI